MHLDWGSCKHAVQFTRYHLRSCRTPHIFTKSSSNPWTPEGEESLLRDSHQIGGKNDYDGEVQTDGEKEKNQYHKKWLDTLFQYWKILWGSPHQFPLAKFNLTMFGMGTASPNQNWEFGEEIPSPNLVRRSATRWVWGFIRSRCFERNPFPRGGFFMGGFQIKNLEEEDPPWTTTPKIHEQGSSGDLLFLRVLDLEYFF